MGSRARSSLRIALFTVVGGALVAAGVLVASFGLGPDTAAHAAGDPVIAAAGDIACDPASASFNGGAGQGGVCMQNATYGLLTSIDPAAVLALGDTQYFCGGYQAYTRSYALSWGKLLAKTYPAIGNHEYLVAPDTNGVGTGCDSSNLDGAGYYRYFASAAQEGAVGQGWYSFDLGAWHLIALNSNCGNAGGCGPGSGQWNWLQQDLASHPSSCTLAYWHIPLWSSGGRAAPNTGPLVQLLTAARADVILSGHDHIYERFGPQDAAGRADPQGGIREFIVGTGGSNHTSIVSVAANSQVRNDTDFGVLKMTLHSGSYDWAFVSVGGSVLDAGSQACHNASSSSTTTVSTASTATTTTAATTTVATTTARTTTAPTTTAPSPPTTTEPTTATVPPAAATTTAAPLPPTGAPPPPLPAPGPAPPPPPTATVQAPAAAVASVAVPTTPATTTTVAPEAQRADLRARVEVSRRNLLVGATFRVTAHVRNAGGGVAMATRLWLMLPAGFRPTGLTRFENAHCAFIRTTEHCEVGRLGAVASTSLSFDVTAGSTGRLRIGLRVRSSSAEADGGDNSDVVRLAVAPLPVCVVPDVRRQTFRVARQALRSSGCAVGRLRFSKEPGRVGRVVREHPPPGRRLGPGARVDLVVGIKR